MKLTDWLNNKIPNIAQSIEDINRDYFFSDKTIGFAGKESINRVLHYLRSALFPGVYEKYPIDEFKVNVLIGNNIRSAALELNDLIEKVFINKCDFNDKEKRDCTKCMDMANDITIELINRLPDIRRILQTDIQAAYDGDPAAHTTEEIIMSYPSITAISIYRISHVLCQLGVPVIPRIMSEYAHAVTGIDIHPGAKIGTSFFVDHGTGVVVGETCEIGNNVKLYQGVTLGAKSFPLDDKGNPIKGIKRHPNIGDNVIIYAGATILGGDTEIGHDSIIGGNVWLTHSVPPFSRVYNSQPSPTIKNGNSDTPREELF
ncbi:MAG: serine acetyltransferase [Clostridiales bacterium]|nr:serine acetyltransferase [Clostridiales bacterium]